jgi:hypothetical protein
MLKEMTTNTWKDIPEHELITDNDNIGDTTVAIELGQAHGGDDHKSDTLLNFFYLWKKMALK